MSKFARKKIRHDEETRAKIQAAQIINRFMKCVMGEIDLTTQQVTCGKSLLDKVLPDLQSVGLNVESDNVEWFIADKPMTVEEYEREFAKGSVDASAGSSNKAPSLPH